MIEGGARHYYEEEVFDQLQFALGFVDKISNEDNNLFLSEIVTCFLNNEDFEAEKEVQIFDFQGRLLCLSSQSDDTIGSSENLVVGDIVKIQPFPWNRNSPTCIETIGVISKMPSITGEQIVSSNDEEYIVDYIRDGYIGHWHVKREAIKKYSGSIPGNLTFLKLLSEHYKGIKSIPLKTLHAIYRGEIFVEKVQHYSFVE